MQNLARRIEDDGARQLTGTVLLTEGASCVVRTASGDHRAARALSCLVAPEAGDLVLVAVAAQGAWVLAVLAREDGTRARVVLEGDLEVRLPHGRFSVAAQEGVDLASGGDVSVVSAGLRVHTGEGRVVVQTLSVLGRLAETQFEKVKLLAGTLDAVLDRVSQTVKRCYRTVEDFDQLRARRVDYAAREVMNLHARSAVLGAEALVKIDGEQIHVG